MKIKLFIVVLITLSAVFGCSRQEAQKEIIKQDVKHKITDLAISPDGQTLVYRVSEGADEIRMPGGGRFVGEDGKYFIVADEKQGKIYDYVSVPFFSSDSKTMIYSAKEKGKEFLVVNDNEITKYDWAKQPVFSDDGKTLAYLAGKNEKMFIVLGEKETEVNNYEEVKALTLSPDGKTIVYIAMKSGCPVLVVGDKEITGYDAVSVPSFTPEGKVAFPAKREEKVFIVVGEKENKMPDYDNVGGLTFSSDGKTMAYMVSKGEVWKRDEFSGMNRLVKAGKQCVVVNNKEGEPFDAVSGLIFNPKSDTVAYRANEGKKANEFGLPSEEGKWLVVAEDKKGKPYRWVGDLTFSPDGRALAYKVEDTVKKGDKTVGKEFIVIGTNEEEKYDLVSKPVFLDNSTVRYFAYDGTNLYRITVK